MSNSQNYDAKIMMHYITAKKNSSQTIVQGGSPWATLILNCMFVVEAHYGVQLLLRWKKSYIPFTISFAKAFFSCFLSPILLGFPEMPDFPKYMMPY